MTDSDIRDLGRRIGRKASQRNDRAIANRVQRSRPGRVELVDEVARTARVVIEGDTDATPIHFRGYTPPNIGDEVEVIVLPDGRMRMIPVSLAPAPIPYAATIEPELPAVEAFIFGTVDPGPYQRPMASAELQGTACVVMDRGRIDVCNGMSWVEGTVRLDHTHTLGEIGIADPALATLPFTFATLAPGPFQRPSASADRLGTAVLLMDEQRTEVCNGQSWVQAAPAVSHTHPGLSDSGAVLPEGIPDAVDIDALLAGHRGNGVMSGGLVNPGPTAMSVSVTATLGWHTNGSATSMGVFSVPAPAADIAPADSLPRLDLVLLSRALTPTPAAAFTFTVITGIPAASPVLPDVPDAGTVDTMVLAAVRVEPTTTTITSAEIKRMRVKIPPPSIVHAADFGVSGQNSADQTAELQAAVDAHFVLGKPLWLDGSNPTFSGGQGGHVTYINVSSTIDATGGNARIYGAGIAFTKLRMLSTTNLTTGVPKNEPVLEIDNSWNHIRGFELSHLPTNVPFASTVSNVGALYCSAPAANLMTLTRIEDLWIRNSSVGIYAPTGFFSNVVENLKIEGFSRYAMNMGVSNSGSTGNVFSNIYIHNTGFPSSTLGGASGQPDACIATVRLLNFTDTVFNQLNVEWVWANHGIQLDACGVIVFNSLHFEGFAGGEPSGAFIFLNGSDLTGTRVIVNGMFAFTTRIDGNVLAPVGSGLTDKSYFVFRCDGPKDEVEVHGIDIQEYGAYYFKGIDGAQTHTQAVCRNGALFGRVHGSSTWTKGSAVFTGPQFYGHGTSYPTVNRVDRWGGAGGEAARNRPMVRQGGQFDGAAPGNSFDGHSHRHLVAGGPANLPTNAKWGFTYLPIVDLIANQVPSAVPTVEPGCVPIAVDYRNQRILGYFATATSPQTAGWKQL